MIAVNQNGIPIYRFAGFARQKGLKHAISGRTGGVSQGAFSTLNLGFSVSDDPDSVRGNRVALVKTLGLSGQEVVCAEQVHGSSVARVGAADGGKGFSDRASAVRGADALVTNEPGAALWLGFADCVPILLFDPEKRAIGIVHAGWRGTVSHIAARAVEAMTREFGSDPASLMAGIGPAIGPCCYTVGAEVIASAKAAFPDDQAIVQPDLNQRARLDLPFANARLLLRSGLKPEKIELSEFCTSCQSDLFFSHRAERGRTGRFAALIALE